MPAGGEVKLQKTKSMNRNLALILFFVSNLLATNLFAVPDLKLNIEHIDNTMGLPSNEIRRIFQDQQGYLWFGSRNGLIRYDGYSFMLIKNSILQPNLMTFNAIMSIADDSNYVWVGTESGLNRWNKKLQQMEKINQPNLNNLRIEKIIPSGDFFWLATPQGVLKYYPAENKVIHCFPKSENYVQTSGVIDMIKDCRGRMWFASWENGLFCYNPEINRLSQYPNIGLRNSAHTLFEDKNGTIWVGSWGSGLFKVLNDDDPKKAYYQPFIPSSNAGSLSSNIIYSINQDSKSGYIWVGHRNGLSILTDLNNPNSFVNYSADNYSRALKDNDVNAVYRDRSGIMWLGLLGGGVSKVNVDISKLQFNSLEPINSKTHNRSICALWYDGIQTLWMGVNYNGLYVYDNFSKQYRDITSLIRPKGSNYDINISEIAFIKRLHELWISIETGGVMRVKLDEKMRPISSTQLDFRICDSKRIYRIYEDKKSNIWILSSTGLYVLLTNGRIIKQTSLNDGIESALFCQSIAEDIEGNLWIGTRKHGVLKVVIQNNTLSLLSFSEQKHQINNNNVLSIFVDHSEQVWAATNGGGLSVFNQKEKKFESVNYKYNIPYDILFNLFEDKYNNLWLSNENALIRIDKSRSGKANIFSSSDGLWNNVFWAASRPVRIDSTQYILGGVRGYNVLETDKMITNNYVPQLTINDFKINGQSVYSVKLRSRIDTVSNQIKLKYYENSFAIEFAALCYKNPKKNYYAYRLKGFEKEWKYVDATQRFVFYTNLSAGTYTFELKASNENSIWNETPLQLKIEVELSPFLSWYAWMIYLFIIGLIARSIYKNVANKVKLNRQVEISEIEKQNTEKLTQTKLKFFTNISHELLTPLTILECVVDDIKRSKQVNDDQTEVMSNNIFRLIRLIRQILEFRKAESDNLRLKVSYGNISEVIRVISDINFKPLNEKRQIHFSIVSNPKYIVGYFDPDKLEKIVYNLLSNAFKYNKPNGFVQVTLNELDDNGKRSLCLSVKDGGIGISKDKLSSIFNRFYDGDYRKQDETGTGIGLSLTKTLVELHHGRITVESQAGIGTEFVVYIPLNMEYYAENEIDINNIDEKEDSKENSKHKIIFNENLASILLVDDNQELLRVVAEPLRDKYNVITAENGLDALEKTGLYPIDLVVSDVMMPEMDGFTLCNKLKENIDTSHIPVILLTAKSRDEDQIQGYESGADSYITKPFKPSLLMTRIAGIFKNREQQAKRYNRQEAPHVTNLEISKIDQQFILKAIQIVEENLENAEFDVVQFEAALNMTNSTLYRKIKSITGTAPTDFIRNIRLKHSCQLLQTGTMNISEVAYAVGFNDPKYFTRCFRKEFGKTPGDYRKEQDGKDINKYDE